MEMRLTIPHRKNGLNRLSVDLEMCGIEMTACILSECQNINETVVLLSIP